MPPDGSQTRRPGPHRPRTLRLATALVPFLRRGLRGPSPTSRCCQRVAAHGGLTVLYLRLPHQRPDAPGERRPANDRPAVEV